MEQIDRSSQQSTIGDGLERISLAIVEFKDGDVLALSDIIDMVAQTRPTTESNPLTTMFWDALCSHLQGCLKTGTPLNQDFLAETLDSLQLIYKQTPKGLQSIDEDLRSMATRWKERFSYCFEEHHEGSLVNTSASSLAQEPAGSVDTKNNGDKASENPFAREDIFKVFLMEARDRLLNAQELCIRLEDSPDDSSTCQELFRIFHTFKGECGFFKLTSIGELAHLFENLLDMVRQNLVPSDSDLIDLLLRGVDRFQSMIDDLEQQKVVIQNQEEFDDLKEAINTLRSAVAPPIGERLVSAGVITESDKHLILQRQKDTGFTKTFGEVAIDKKLVSKDDIEAAITKKIDKDEQFIKVKAGQINYLVDMVGELIIAQSQVGTTDPNMIPLRKITKEIQASAIKLRTTKLKSVFLNIHRTIRDVSAKVGKDIKFKYSGEELEVDRNLVEGLGEPLLHLVRNAIHHGIESTQQRIDSGKAPIGTVSLGAQRRGNSIVISLEDDGAGLNRKAIIEKALLQGLITVKAAETINDKDVWDLIVRPGFTTAEKVDQISGRGVGMDIVRTFVLSHRGRIDIQTEPGKFTRFSLHFPINTAIIDGLIARIADYFIVVPVNQVVETLNFSTAEKFKVGSSVDVINLRERIIPVIDLALFFDQGANGDKRRVGMVVEDSYQSKFLFIVDQIIGKSEVVVKSLGPMFKNIKSLNSGTVLPGGRIAYIIDIDNVILESGTK